MNSFPTDFNNERRFDFQSGAAGCTRDTFAVVEMSGEEAISQPYRFELVLVSEDARLDLDAVLVAPACLRILAPVSNGARVAEAEPYHGMLAEFEQLEQLGGYTFYRAVLVPRLWALSQYRSSEVYLHEQSITGIIESVLRQEARFSAGHDFELRLTDSYRPRSYVCQYQESPLDFISRWMEREGMYYCFEQMPAALGARMGHERLVVLDARLAQPLAGRAVSYRPADELDTGLSADSVQSFVCRTRRLPRAIVLQDFNHRRAGLPLVARAEVSPKGLGEEMLYGENFRNPEEGERYARIRAQELLCKGQVFSGQGTATGLRSGRFLDLSHHYRADFDGRYFVTRVSHEGSQAGALLAGLKTPYNQREGRTHYSNSFEALHEQVQFRPERSTPRPRVAGTMTATIDAEGSGEYAELDEYGQYKVQVPFDRSHKDDGKGSARIRMATPYAGSDHGMHFPLLKGAEVLLSFTDGDPDQPVITGAVPNSLNPSVIDQDSAHDNLISTSGGNQLLMKDTEGKEVIWLNSPFHGSSLGIGSVHPDGDGSIFSATKGGSDSVSFGHNNSMSFGSKNVLSLGTEASLGASFANKVTMGASIGINLSSDVKWNMNLIPLTKAYRDKKPDIRSLSIDDSESTSFKPKASLKGLEQVTIQGGVPKTAYDLVGVDASVTAMRVLIGALTAANFAQSAVYGAAVNGNLTMDRDKDYQKSRDIDNAAQKKADDDQRAARKSQVDDDWAARNPRDAAALKVLEDRKSASALTALEKAELQGLQDQRKADTAEQKKASEGKAQQEWAASSATSAQAKRLVELEAAPNPSDAEKAERSRLQAQKAAFVLGHTAVLDKQIDGAWSAAHPGATQRMGELQKKEKDGPLSAAEKDALQALKARKDEETYASKKNIDKEFDAKAAARNAPSNPTNQGFMGWPGIIGKFGLDMGLTWGGMAALQAWAQSVTAKIDDLQHAGKITIDETGLVQGFYRKPPKSDVSYLPDNDTGPRSHVALTSDGIDVLSGAVKDFDGDTARLKKDVRPTAGWVQITAGTTEICNGKSTMIESPLLTIRSGKTTDEFGAVLNYQSDSISIKTSETAASFRLQKNQVVCAGGSIQIGTAQNIPNPSKAVLKSQLTVARQAAATLMSKDIGTFRDYVSEDDVAMKGAKYALWRTTHEAYLQAVATAKRLAIQEQQTSGANVKVLNGLKIDEQTSTLSSGAASVKVASSGADVVFGGASLKLSSAGFIGDGPVIKLG